LGCPAEWVKISPTGRGVVTPVFLSSIPLLLTELPYQGSLPREGRVGLNMARKKEDYGYLLPSEVKSIRTRLKLTQHEAGDIFGGGANAFSRYERGEARQSLALDRLLRLLRDNKIGLTDISGGGSAVPASAEAIAPRKRGRPAKAPTPVVADAPRKRGRPAKNAPPIVIDAPKKRGRPAKVKAIAVASDPSRRERPVSRPALAMGDPIVNIADRKKVATKPEVEAIPEKPRRALKEKAPAITIKPAKTKASMLNPFAEKVKKQKSGNGGFEV